MDTNPKLSSGRAGARNLPRFIRRSPFAGGQCRRFRGAVVERVPRDGRRQDFREQPSFAGREPFGVAFQAGRDAGDCELCKGHRGKLGIADRLVVSFASRLQQLTLSFRGRSVQFRCLRMFGRTVAASRITSSIGNLASVTGSPSAALISATPHGIHNSRIRRLAHHERLTARRHHEPHAALATNAIER
jgi:hypothetical protein